MAKANTIELTKILDTFPLLCAHAARFLFGIEMQQSGDWRLVPRLVGAHELGAMMGASSHCCQALFTCGGNRADYGELFPDIKNDVILLDALGEYLNYLCSLFSSNRSCIQTFGVLYQAPPIGCRGDGILYPPVYGITGSIEAMGLKFNVGFAAQLI